MQRRGERVRKDSEMRGGEEAGPGPLRFVGFGGQCRARTLAVPPGDGCGQAGSVSELNKWFCLLRLGPWKRTLGRSIHTLPGNRQVPSSRPMPSCAALAGASYRPVAARPAPPAPSVLLASRPNYLKLVQFLAVHQLAAAQPFAQFVLVVHAVEENHKANHVNQRKQCVWISHLESPRG